VRTLIVMLATWTAVTLLAVTRPAPLRDAQVLRHAFPPSQPAAADAELLVHPVEADVRESGRPGEPPLDLADYGQFGSLTLSRAVIAWSPAGAAVVPPGAYTLGLLPAPPGAPPTLVLVGQDGLRLRLPLEGAPAAGPRPNRLVALEVPSRETTGASWSVALRFPTAAGILTLAPAGHEAAGVPGPPAATAAAQEASPGAEAEPPATRRRTRGDILKDRAQGPGRRRIRKP
jgi:hypothetical protein